MLPLMVSRLPLGAGTLLDVKRAARVRTVIDGGAWTAGLHKVWEPLRGEPARTCPVPGTTLRGRWPCLEFVDRGLPSAVPSGALQLPIQRGSHTSAAHTARKRGS